ncbi:MAG: large-conductance mechanosensitive channel protein MscL [Bacteroidetes bacterium]|nr:large-conductance mechanosensitive channel protein MscL [Bacteroidota bacterium]
MLKEFKEFALKGNVLDMAVGIIIGAAFGTIVQSLVKDVIMPPIGLLLGDVDFSELFVVLKQGAKAAGPYTTLKDAASAGAVTLNYGLFINSVVSFLIVAFSIFLVVKGFQQLRKKEVPVAKEPTTKDCPFCLSPIPIKATKCAHCTSNLS